MNGNGTLSSDNQIRCLEEDVAGFAQEFIANDSSCHQERIKKAKIVHDPLWGTIRLHPWEVELLDLPLLQRLRQIRQTSLVSYVFPGCTHTRFEHTLGVLHQTQRLVDAVGKNAETESEPRFPDDVVHDLRLAALFHDTGHSCLSHISEDLLLRCEDIKAWRQAANAVKCSPHETLGALILKSAPVRNTLSNLETKYSIKFNVDRAANWIMGSDSGTGVSDDMRYAGQVINGPFDADKLDYIFRDSHYSGIPLGLDLERLWASCSIKKHDDGPTILTLQQSSVSPLEQILFNKTNLFAIVYQHPKVRAAERMYHALVEGVQNGDSEPFQTSGREINFSKAVDFLWFTDDTLFAEALRRGKDDHIHKRIHAIRYRKLLVRALTISHDTVNTADNMSASGFAKLRTLNQSTPETYKARRQLAKAILEEAGIENDANLWPDIWIDIPSDPKFGEADRTYVVTPAGSMRKVSDLFPVHYWSDLFAKYKWRGHVFCPEKHQQAIHESAIRVLFREFRIQVNRSAGELSHVPEAKVTEELV
jgi:HD superfamily phosphohydrolase